MKYLFYSAAIALTGLLTACSQSDELVDDKTTPGKEVKGKTTFGGFQTNQGQEKRNAPVRRTSLDHTSVGVASNPFFWELGDNLWVQNGTTLQKNSSNDITSPKTPYARFYFDGVFDDTQYQVYYRGNNESTSNTVVIATQQKQETANSSKHFGASGDCGTATAKRNSSGIYEFTLQHKAAYLSIVPRMTDTSLGANTYLKQVKIVSNNTIAGTYDFSSGSLSTNPTNESKEITVTCGGNDGFPLTGSSAADALAKTGVYAVIAPGNHTLRLEYTITDKTKNVTGTVYQYLNANTFAENTLTDIVVDLNTRIIDIASFKYYRWDAKKDLFDGQTSRPHFHNEVGNFSPNTDYSTASAFSPAVNSLKDAPNINETLWYLQRGDAMMEKNVLYKFDGHLYSGIGLWLKKKAYIDNFSENIAPDGKDYRTKEPANQNAVSCPIGRPEDPSKYFFLPAKGGVQPLGGAGGETSGRLNQVTQEGYYWTSTAKNAYPNYSAYMLYFEDGKYWIYFNANLALRRFGFADWIGE